MIKSELLNELSKKIPDLEKNDVDLAVNSILTQMSDALANGERIEIRGFGSFDLHYRQSRIGRNPKTGETVNLAAKSVLHFKAR